MGIQLVLHIPTSLTRSDSFTILRKVRRHSRDRAATLSLERLRRGSG